MNREQLIHHHFNELQRLLEEEADDMSKATASMIDALHHDYTEAKITQ